MGYLPIPKKSAAPSSGGAELRQAARKKVLVTGKIIWDAGGHVLDCSILDISATGARTWTIQTELFVPLDCTGAGCGDR